MPYPLASSGRDAQFAEMRLQGLEVIATAFGVPLSVVGLGRSPSYGSLTEESRALVRSCFAPWARRVEKQLALALLSEEGRRVYSIEHDLDELLRSIRPRKRPPASPAQALAPKSLVPVPARWMLARGKRNCFASA